MTLFCLPDLGEGLAEAEIHAWHVKEGDTVQVDQPMVSVETAKALVDVPAPHAGKILKLYGKPGDIIPTHAPLVEFDNQVGQTQIRVDAGTVVGELPQSTQILIENNTVFSSEQMQNALKKSVKVMPAVRALANTLQVALESVQPTGPQGQITAEDVQRAADEVKKNKIQIHAEINNQTLSTSSKTMPLQGVRRQMAQAMMQSHHEIVPVTIVEDADVTDAPADFTVFLLQALTSALQQVPALNATFHYDVKSKNFHLTLHDDIHIGLAVDSPEGLFVPVLKNCAARSATELRDMVNRAKQGVKTRSLQPSDFQAATFSLSNFGTIAGRYANPIIVPPAVAILGCGKVRLEPVVRENAIVIRKIAPLSLTFDHRAVTGGEASRFLAAVILFLQGVT